MDEIETEKIRIPNETYCPNHDSNKQSLSKNIPSEKNNNTSKNNSTNTIDLKILNTFTSDDEGISIPPIKSILPSASSPPKILEPFCKLEKFLPPKKTKHNKTLVIDLDETLIHSYFDVDSPRKPDLSYDIFVEKKKIHVNSLIRPGAFEFLENLSLKYEMVIFTASLSQYANPLLDFLDKNKKCNFRLYREHCCSYNNGFTNCFTKDLKKLDRDMKNLIIVDNNPRSYILNKENGLPIKTWLDDVNDRELVKLIPYLEFLGNEYIEDVRPILSQINKGASLDFDKFDEIIKEYRENKNKNKSIFENINNCNNEEKINNRKYSEINDATINNDDNFEDEEPKKEITEEKIINNVDKNENNNFENKENIQNNYNEKSKIINYNNKINNENNDDIVYINEKKNDINNNQNILEIENDKYTSKEYSSTSTIEIDDALESGKTNEKEHISTVSQQLPKNNQEKNNKQNYKLSTRNLFNNKNNINPFRSISNNQDLNSSLKSNFINHVFSRKLEANVNNCKIFSKELYNYSNKISQEKNNMSCKRLFKEDKTKSYFYLVNNKKNFNLFNQNKKNENNNDLIIPKVKRTSKNSPNILKVHNKSKNSNIQSINTNSMELISQSKTKNKLHLNTGSNIENKMNNNNNLKNLNKNEHTVKQSASNFYIVKNNPAKILTSSTRNNTSVLVGNTNNNKLLRRPTSCINNLNKKKTYISHKSHTKKFFLKTNKSIAVVGNEIEDIINKNKEGDNSKNNIDDNLFNNKKELVGKNTEKIVLNEENYYYEVADIRTKIKNNKNMENMENIIKVNEDQRKRFPTIVNIMK